MTKSNGNIFLVAFIFFFFIFIFSILSMPIIGNRTKTLFSSGNIRILSSEENKDLEDSIRKYANNEKINVEFTYMGDLEIVEELNNHSDNYDAVWISNSIWLYMLDNTYLTSESKSISISPVVMGIKKSKAESLGLIHKEIYNKDLLELIKNKKIKYVMSSVTGTNTGATAYLGFLNTLAGSPEVLTESMLDNDVLIKDMTDVFSGVERVSGEENYLETMFLNSDLYEAVIASESSLIRINQTLKNRGKEELYLIYPIDGVAINDSTFAFIDHKQDKKEDFLKLQNYLLSDKGQKNLEALGRRTWYGGVTDKANQTIFNKDWGIDTTKYLVTTKYPSKSVMTKAINLYIEQLRKPTHTVFCLDYSGSMYGEGIQSLRNAMDYILTYENASKDKLQFSKNDKITVITFSSDVTNVWDASGKETSDLKNKINTFDVGGNTALYDAVIKGMDILDEENDDYTKTIIAMTDGQINLGSLFSLQNRYRNLKQKVPVYSITFGSARESQLEEIANTTNAKVFDGKENLLAAFKEVRRYN